MRATDVRCLEWFFGYGGNHLGLKRAIPNLRLIAACEIEAYACANVVAKMEAGHLDPAPLWTNCKTFPLAPFRGLVDIFIASYPCQGFSSAGKREGQKDPRFLWPWVLRAIAVIQPRYCFFENVDAHVSLGLSTVLSDLEEAGYRHASGIYSAAECGAPQQRKRVFILAERKTGMDTATSARRDSARNRTETLLQSGQCLPAPGCSQLGQSTQRNVSGLDRSQVGTGQKTNPQRQTNHHQPDRSSADSAKLAHTAQLGKREPHHPTTTVNIQREARQTASGRSNEICGVGQADSECARSQRRQRSGTHDQGTPAHGPATECSPIFWPAYVSRPGQPQHAWEPARVIETQRGLGGGVNGRAANVDRLRLLGNGVYPAAAERAFRELSQKLNHA